MSKYINIVKGMAIIAIVLSHIDFRFFSVPLFPMNLILGSMWHVAVFFLIGGFFIKEERLLNPVKFIRGKIRSLYRLLLFFYIPAVLLA